jgi:hypothetical protein
MSTKSDSKSSFKKQFSSVKEPERQELQSFLHVGQHVRCLKRLENGHKSLAELQNFIKERAILEENYAESLRKWATKHGQIFSKGSEYNTTKLSIQDNLNEAHQVADLHSEISNKLRQEIQTVVKDYQKQHYHPNMMSGFKEVSKYEKEFSKPVKKWAKVYGNMKKCQNEYYNACKQEITAEKQVAGTENDINTAKQQEGSKLDALETKLTKQKNMLKKRTSQVKDTREKYRKSVEDCDNERAAYKAEMNDIFSKTNIDEKARLQFYKQTISKVYQTLDLSESHKYKRIYQDAHDICGKINVDGDIEWWSSTKGIGMNMDWPIFEEYDQVSVKSLSQKQSSHINKHVAGGSSIGTLSYKENKFDKDFEPNDFNSPPLPTAYGDADLRPSVHSISERLTEELGKGDTNNNNLKEPPKDAKSLSSEIPAAGEEPPVLVEAMFEYGSKT